jgi:hypothetical protein
MPRHADAERQFDTDGEGAKGVPTDRDRQGT